VLFEAREDPFRIRGLEITLPLSPADCGMQFHPGKIQNGKMMAAGTSGQYEQLLCASLLHIQLGEGAGVQVVKAQRLAPFAQHGV
jgi:hypothetical protein